MSGVERPQDAKMVEFRVRRNLHPQPNTSAAEINSSDVRLV